ncbi:phage major tail protein, TP901-1 family [Cytobacillus firmus]|uniref:phage major tail protein, TP901-1 family n=1 Tax=Bacillus sp. 22-7 TaxID=2709707 RepID=UPI0013D6BF1B|nr:phage major tail protein, TP901-1 family [Bacillus sp. 22-7]
MGKIQGMKCKVFIHKAGTSMVLAGQRNATLNRSAETIDATSKSSEGNWKESLPGFKEFSIDCDGAFVTDDGAYIVLEEEFINGNTVDVYLEMPNGSKYFGNAVITDLPLEFPYDDLATYSVSLQGNGALTVAPAGTELA